MSGARVWVLVADGMRARILRGFGQDDTLDPIEIASTAESVHLRDIMDDKPGRGFSSGSGGRRSAMEPGSDPVRRDMQDFAQALFSTLESHHRAGDFDQLAIFAAPAMLGILRQEMPASLNTSLVADRAVNLMPLSAHELRQTAQRLLLEEKEA
jgi:protein required for attachment to host cells